MEKVISYGFDEMKQVAEKYDNERAVMRRLEVRLNEDIEGTYGGDVWLEAVATINIPFSGGGYKIQEISSGGLFGLCSNIEIDAEVFQDEEAQLFDFLNTLNVATDLFKDEEEA